MSDEVANLVLTRPQEASRQFLEMVLRVARVPLRSVMSPLMKIVPLSAQVDLSAAKGIIFSSANGVRHAGRAHDIPAYCVGRQTTIVATNHGWQARFLGADAGTLKQALIKEKVAAPLVHVGGVHRRGAIVEDLCKAGILTTRLDVYDQVLLDLSNDAQAVLSGEKPSIIPLFSPRTARHFASQVQFGGNMHILALSDAVMEPVNSVPATSRQVVHSPDVETMVHAVANLLDRVETGETQH